MRQSLWSKWPFSDTLLGWKHRTPCLTPTTSCSSIPSALAEPAQGPRCKAPSPGQGWCPALQQLQCTNRNYEQELLPRPGWTPVALEVLTATPLKYYFFQANNISTAEAKPGERATFLPLRKNLALYVHIPSLICTFCTTVTSGI